MDLCTNRDVYLIEKRGLGAADERLVGESMRLGCCPLTPPKQISHIGGCKMLDV